MAVFLSPVGGVAAQFFSNNGVPLSGGKLYSYAAGTTTPLVTYTSSSGGTAHTNPIILDSAGRVASSGEIWLQDNTQYKFVLKDSNEVLIATYDNINGINSNFSNFISQEEVQTATAGQTVFTLVNPYVVGANTLSVFVDGVNQYDGSAYAYVETDANTVTFTSGLHVGALVKFTTVQSLTTTQSTTAALVTYTPAGTGAVTTTVQAKLRQTVSVIDFGADPTGTSNATTAFTNALAAGQNYDLGGGTYLIDSLTIPDCTITNGTLKLTANSRLTVNTGCTFDGVTIDCQDLAVNVAAIYVFGGKFNFHNSEITNIDSSVAVAAQYGIILKMQPSTGLDQVEFSIRDSKFSNITNTDDGAPAGSGFCGGVFFFGDEASLSNYTKPCSGVIDNCSFDNIYTQTGSGATIDNCDADAIRFYVDAWTASFNVIFPVTISNCRFKDIQKSCIKNAGGNGMTVNDAYVDANRTDFTMLAAIRIQTAYDCIINGLTFNGNVKYLYALSTKRCQINDTNTTLSSDIEQGVFFQLTSTASYGVIVNGGVWHGVTRLLGTNVTSTAFAPQSVLLSNILGGSVTSPSSPYIYAAYFDDLKLDNVRFSTTSVLDVVSLLDSTNTTITSCNFVSARRAIAMDVNNVATANLKITDCDFETTGVGIGYRLVSIRPTSGTQLTPDGVFISGCKLTRTSYTSSTNDDFLLLQASNVKIDNIQMVLKHGAGEYASTTAMQLVSCTKVQITNISYTCDFTFNAGWAGWTALLNSCTYATVYNIHGGCRRGVEFTSTSNCTYNNIAAVVGETVTSVTGGTNIVAGAELNAVL